MHTYARARRQAGQAADRLMLLSTGSRRARAKATAMAMAGRCMSSSVAADYEFRSIAVQGTDGNDATSTLRKWLDERPVSPDALFFFTHAVEDDHRIATGLSQHIPECKILGVNSGWGVIGNNEELENKEAVTALAAYIPGVKVLAFESDDLLGAPQLEGEAEWADFITRTPKNSPDAILFAGTTGFNESYLRIMDNMLPHGTKLGGLVDGHMFLGDEGKQTGSVGLLFDGPIHIEPMVCQGCMPLSEERFKVSASFNSFITELDGRPPLEVLLPFLEEHSRDPKGHLFGGLTVDASAIRENNEDIVRPSPSFLVRHIMQLSNEGVALAVEPNYLEENTEFSLQLLNRETAMVEIGLALKERERPLGAMMFPCSGRGSNLYGRPGVETDLLRAKWGADLATAGYFAAGEIGPVGFKTYIHAFTTSFALFRHRGSNP